MIKPSLSIIIPTLNEEEGIAKTLCSIPEEIRNYAQVIVVDASDDLTPVIATRLGATVLKEKKKGKGWQMRQGVLHSTGEILVFLDGDGQHSGQDIPKLLKKLEKTDLVLGCSSWQRLNGEDEVMRQLFQFYKMFIYPMLSVLNMHVSDPLTGFRAIRRTDWDKLDLKSNGFEIEIEMNIQAVENHFTIDQVLIPTLKRAGGISGSKFLKNPNMWFRISKMVWDYKLGKDKAKK